MRSNDSSLTFSAVIRRIEASARAYVLSRARAVFKWCTGLTEARLLSASVPGALGGRFAVFLSARTCAPF